MRLDSREARRKLASANQPYWVNVARGTALGFRKGAQGATWYLRRFRGGRYTIRALGATDDDHPADGLTRLSWKDALRAALSEPRRTGELRTYYTVSDAIHDNFEDRKARGKSQGALRNDRYYAGAFVEEFGTKPVADLTTEDFSGWLDKQVAAIVATKAHDELSEDELREVRRRAENSVNRKWNPIRAALNRAFKAGRVESDVAWRRVEKFKNVDLPRTRVLSIDEARLLLKHAPPDFAILAHASLVSGLRIGELRRLTAACVMDRGLSVSTREPHGERNVPLSTEGAALFARIAKGKAPDDPLFLDGNGAPWGGRMLERRMAAARAAAGIIGRVTFHDLRRTYGSVLASAGVRDTIIAAALGHANVATTRRLYAQVLDKTIAREIGAKLPMFATAKRKAKVKQPAVK
jgi:integrase